MNKDELKKFFVNDDTRYTIQVVEEGTGKVKFINQDAKLDLTVLAQHLQGLKTIGAYPVKDGKTKWFCIDIDIVKEVYTSKDFDRDKYIAEVNKLADEIKTKFATHEIPFYKEETGGKGTHLWCFFAEPVKVSDVLQAVLPIVKTIIYDKKVLDVEWFPTSENSKSVKLPAGNNKRYNIFSQMEVPMAVVKTVPLALLLNLSNPLEQTFIRCRTFRELKEKATVEKELRNKERLAIASMCSGLDKPYLEFTERYFFKGLNDYDHDITWRNLTNSVTETKPQRCAYLQQEGVCSAQCTEIGTYKSPIGFFHQALKERKAEETVSFIDPQQALLKQGNSFLYRGQNNQNFRLTNFVIDVLEERRLYDDLEGEPVKTMLYGKITTEHGDEYEFEMDKKDFSNNSLMEEHIYDIAGIGNKLWISTKKIDLIKQCINKYSRPTVTKTTMNFGFNKDKTVYYTPSLRIDKDEIKSNEDILVSVTSATRSELESHLDLRFPIPPRSERYWKDYITQDVEGLFKNTGMLYAGLSHIFDLFVKHIYGPEETSANYILWYTGQPGYGKSKLASLLFRMFGNFPKNYLFSSTAGRLEYSGYFYKDAIFLIDDFKLSNFSDFQKTEIFRLLQSYADRGGRQRLTRNINAQKEYWIRGNLMVTGEDIIVQESSNIARAVRISFNPESVNYDPELFVNVHSKSIDINELTPFIIQWCLNLNAKAVSDLRKFHETRLSSKYPNAQNNSRVAANFSRVVTAGLLAIDYFYSDSTIEERMLLHDNYIKFIDETFDSQMRIISDENVGAKFWNTLQEMLAVNKVRIALHSELLEDNPKVPIVGFIQDSKIYIMHKTAVNLVRSFYKNSGINISDVQLAENLFQLKYYEHHPAKIMPFNGKNVQVFSVNTARQHELTEIEHKDESNQGIEE